MKYILLFAFILYVYSCATFTITSPDDILIISIPLQTMVPSDLLSFQQDCLESGSCSYLAGLVLGGSNADNSFYRFVNQNPPSNLPLDLYFSLRAISNKTFGDIARQLNVEGLTEAISIPSRGCQLDQIPTTFDMSRDICIDNPSVVRISRNNRDALIFSLGIGCTVLLFIILLIIFKKTKIIDTISVEVQKKLSYLK